MIYGRRRRFLQSQIISIGSSHRLVTSEVRFKRPDWRFLPGVSAAARRGALLPPPPPQRAAYTRRNQPAGFACAPCSGPRPLPCPTKPKTQSLAKDNAPSKRSKSGASKRSKNQLADARAKKKAKVEGHKTNSTADVTHTKAAGGQAAGKREQRTENRGRPKPQQLRHSLPLAIARYFAAPSIISAYQKHRLRFRRRAGHREQDSGPPGESTNNLNWTNT